MRNTSSCHDDDDDDTDDGATLVLGDRKEEEDDDEQDEEGTDIFQIHSQPRRREADLSLFGSTCGPVTKSKHKIARYVFFFLSYFDYIISKYNIE